MKPPSKRIFSIIFFFLLTFSLVAGGRKRKTKYYTVLENTSAMMRCDFPDKDPNQVLWVKGKIAVMSLDGEEFNSIAEMLDPQLGTNFRLESGESSSTLVIDKADMDNPNVQHPGTYKCLVDLTHEQKYELSIVKNDFRCIVKNPSNFDEPLLVGTKMEIECSVTKDRIPRGALDFTLLVDGGKVKTGMVLGEDLWKAGTNVAKIDFVLDLVKEYHNKSISVRLAINQFADPSDVGMPRVELFDQLRLTYGLGVECPMNQIYLLDSAVSSAISPRNQSIEGIDHESHPFPLPFCDVEAAADLPLPYLVNWFPGRPTVSLDEVRDAESSVNFTKAVDDDESVLFPVVEDFIVLTNQLSTNGSHTFRVSLKKKSVDELVQRSQNQPRSISFRISDVDFSPIESANDIDVRSRPYLSCYGCRNNEQRVDSDNLAFQIGSESDFREFSLHCTITSSFKVETIKITANHPVKFLNPGTSLEFESIEGDVETEHTSMVSEFKISFTKGWTDDASMQSFFDSFKDSSAADGSKKLVHWKAKVLILIPKVSSTPVSIVTSEVEQESDHSELIEEEEINIVREEEHEENTNLVEDFVEEDKSDGDIAANVNNSVAVYDRNETEIPNSASSLDNEGDGQDLVEKPLTRVRRDAEKSLERSTEPVTSELLYSSFQTSQEKSGKPVAFFSADIGYRAGLHELRLVYSLPSVSVTYAPSLRCDELITPSSLPFQIKCRYAAVPPVDLTGVSILASPDLSERLSGHLQRSSEGFIVSGSLPVVGAGEGFTLSQLRGRKENLVIQVQRPGSVSLESSVKIDFAGLKDPPKSTKSPAKSPAKIDDGGLKRKEFKYTPDRPRASAPDIKNKDTPVTENKDTPDRPWASDPDIENKDAPDTENKDTPDSPRASTLDTAEKTIHNADLSVGEIGKSVEGDGINEAGVDSPFRKMMRKDWFLPVVGSIGGVVVISIAIAVFAGLRRRARNTPARMDQHVVGSHPDEDDAGFEDKPASCAPSDAGNEGGDTSREHADGREGIDDLEAARNVANDGDLDENFNSNNYRTDDNTDFGNVNNINNNNIDRCDEDYESDEEWSTSVHGESLGCPTSPDIKEMDGVCRYDDSGVCRFGDVATPDHAWIPSAESLIVPDDPPTPIKYSAIKAMQSFPANVVLSPSKKTVSQAEVDV